MSQNKVDYPFLTHVNGTTIEESVKSQKDVDDYYNSYGRGTYIWHSSWKEAYDYVRNNIKRQKKHWQEALKKYREEERKLNIRNKIMKLQELL